MYVNKDGERREACEVQKGKIAAAELELLSQQSVTVNNGLVPNLTYS